MSFDPLVTNPGRLSILTALAGSQPQEFVRLRSHTQMTDGNLATHARRLQVAGFVDIHKSLRNGKPVTTYTLTRQGRTALESHVSNLMAAMTDGPSKPANPAPLHDDPDDWVD